MTDTIITMSLTVNGQYVQSTPWAWLGQGTCQNANVQTQFGTDCCVDLYIIEYNTAVIKPGKTKTFCKRCHCQWQCSVYAAMQESVLGLESVSGRIMETVLKIGGQFRLNIPICAIKGHFYGNYTVAICQRTSQLFTQTTLVIKMQRRFAELLMP